MGMRNPGSPVSVLLRLVAAALSGLVVVGGLTLVLASGPAAAASSSSSSSSKSGFSAFRTCLSQHGVTLKARPSGSAQGGAFGGSGGTPPTGGTPPAGGFRGGFAGGGNSKQAKAFAACRSKLPAGGFGGGPGGGTFKPTAAQQQALTNFEQCMSTHGVKIAAGSTFQTIRSLMQADPSAASACRSDLNGAFGPPRGASGGSSSSGNSSGTSNAA